MLRKEVGFTLIETVLALAVSAAMLSIAFTGHTSFKNNAEILDAAESVRNSIVELQNQALAGVTETSGGNNPNHVFFGSRAYFGTVDPLGMLRPGAFYTDKIVFRKDGSFIQGEREVKHIELKYGLFFDDAGSSADEVVFVRNQANGQLETYAFNNIFHTADGDLNRYIQANIANAEVNFRFRNNNGRFFDIFINPKTNTIRRGAIQ